MPWLLVPDLSISVTADPLGKSQWIFPSFTENVLKMRNYVLWVKMSCLSQKSEEWSDCFTLTERQQ